MRKVLSVLLCLVFVQVVLAQVERTATPLGFGLEEFTFNSFTIESEMSPEILLDDVTRNQFNAFPYRYALPNQTSLSPFDPITSQNPWTWIPLENGDGIWIISIHCPGAKSIALNFDSFRLDPGVTVVMYNEELEEVIGELTHQNNNPSNKFGSVPLSGDRIFLELFVPNGKDADLEITTVSCAYKIPGLSVGTESCAMNGMCEENVGRRAQLGSLVQILTGHGTMYSSGVLVNSNASNGKPYIITSSKNIIGDPATWSFVFNYKSESCDGVYIDDNFTVSAGAKIVKESEDNDLILLELFDSPSIDWDTFYNGWNRSNQIPTRYFSMHHAFGGVTHMARGDYDIEMTTLNGQEVWKVPGWQDGRMDPGSLGAPLFDNNGLVMGFYVGGDIDCQDGAAPGNDYFIPFYTCWSDFKSFLDPQNNSPEAILGRDAIIEPTNRRILENKVAVFPTPAEEFIYVFNENDEPIKGIHILDSQGRYIETLPVNNNSQRVDVSHLPRGWYIFKVELETLSSNHTVILK